MLHEQKTGWPVFLDSLCFGCQGSSSVSRVERNVRQAGNLRRATWAAFALEHDAGVANWNAASRARLSRATRLVFGFRSSPLLAACAAWRRVYDGFDGSRG
jgi:hypothetical protein